MKLRVRCLESKETFKIETPSPFSLQDLKSAISGKVSSLPETLHLSLNRKDKIDDSSPQASLQSLGINSGDLIFYTINPNDFSSETLVHTPTTRGSPQIQQGEAMDICENFNEKPFDMEDVDVDESVLMGNSSSVPCFLRKVLKEDISNAESGRKLLIMAVHAVLLESGFVCFDSASAKKIDGVHLPEGWASMSTAVRVHYTLPDLLVSGCDVLETVILKFQTLGKFVNVYGSLTTKGSGVYGLSLDESRFVPSINFVWTIYNSQSGVIDKDGSSKSSHEKEVFEFWKLVKDGLALPLLIDLCDETGLDPPPCFMRLPTELKIRVLELLPGVDVAKFGCVCSEMKYLSSNNNLWKQNFEEEFGLCDMEGIQGGGNWKERFSICWERRRKRRGIKTIREQRIVPERPRPFGFPYFPVRRDPVPFGVPRIVGGDYDMLPGFGAPVPFGSARDFPRFPARRNFSPHCNFRGFNA
uniref:F-box domain-containing protein n=1 Tax=Nelumbo nucifera TaxID=4432 RepID=A0A822ZQI1_NELNU|nr:TPA_asm: hypothetical protein HUJ06_018171 [Nelumbo nucifera]